MLAVLGWLGKTLIEKWLELKGRQFEAGLQAKANSTIEELKDDLQRQSLEHRIKFEKLHEKRADVIANLYAQLSEALVAAESFLSPLQYGDDSHMREKFNTAIDKSNQLYLFFDKHRLYLPEEVCQMLEQLLGDVRGYVIKLGVYFRAERELDGQSQTNRLEAWVEGWEAIKEQVPAARRKLEEEFRALL